MTKKTDVEVPQQDEFTCEVYDKAYHSVGSTPAVTYRIRIRDRVGKTWTHGLCFMRETVTHSRIEFKPRRHSVDPAFVILRVDATPIGHEDEPATCLGEWAIHSKDEPKEFRESLVKKVVALDRPEILLLLSEVLAHLELSHGESLRLSGEVLDCFARKLGPAAVEELNQARSKQRPLVECYRCSDTGIDPEDDFPCVDCRPEEFKASQVAFPEKDDVSSFGQASNKEKEN